MSSRGALAIPFITLTLIAPLTYALAQESDRPPSACTATLDRVISHLSSAGTMPDSFNQAFASIQRLKQELASACTAAAKDADSGAAQCERSKGKWDAGRGSCQGFDNSKVEIFGSTVEQVTFCWNRAIYLRLADGTGVIWTAETDTFKRGPARNVKDFVAGVTDKAYFCLAQKVPMIVWEASHIKALVHRPYRPDDDSQWHADRDAARARELDEQNRKISSYSEQIKGAPGNVSALTQRGNAYLEIASYPNAIADFNQVIALRPSDAGAWSNRCWARAIANLGLDKALNDANESLRLKPNAIDALNCRGLISLRLGQLDEAR